MDRGRGDASTAVQAHPELATFAVRKKPLLAWSDASGPRTEELQGRVLIGSSPHAGLRLADPAVSRLHAEIEQRPDGQVWIRDLGSTNGTWVDGVFIREARLAPGAKLRLGATSLAFDFAAGSAKTPLWPADRLGPLVARSESMRSLFYVLADYARTDSPVLVQGETGTGKELVARAIHETSPRANGPFVVVDCGALPETLLESELFGHVKGSFTGATTTRAGAFEAAEGGTVFIDEIGELPLSMQPKLLRVLESQTVRRVGESNHRRVDVRFVAATHRDLRAMVAAGSFREDVYFRLAVLPVFVPPLRDRPEDVGLLLDHFLAHRQMQIPPELLRELERCPWPGNVRELRSFTERAAAIGPVRAWEMTRGLRSAGNSIAPEPARPSSRNAGEVIDPDVVDVSIPFKVLREARNDRFEREYLKALIARHGRHDVGVLADAAGLDRSYVHRLLRRHEL